MAPKPRKARRRYAARICSTVSCAKCGKPCRDLDGKHARYAVPNWPKAKPEPKPRLKYRIEFAGTCPKCGTGTIIRARSNTPPAGLMFRYMAVPCIWCGRRRVRVYPRPVQRLPRSAELVAKAEKGGEKMSRIRARVILVHESRARKNKSA